MLQAYWLLSGRWIKLKETPMKQEGSLGFPQNPKNGNNDGFYWNGKGKEL